MTNLRIAALGLGYLPNKAIGLSVLLLLTFYPGPQRILRALRRTQMCVRMYHTKASFQITARGTYFKGKVRETGEEMPAASAPFKQGLLHLVFLQGNSHSHWGTFFSFFFFWREKNNGFVAAVPGPPCPQWAEDATVPLDSESSSGTRGRTK